MFKDAYPKSIVKIYGSLHGATLIPFDTLDIDN